jgi:hypothetical protein
LWPSEEIELPKPPTDFADEALHGADIFSFVVRIWKEESDKDPASWRGHITPIPVGKRHYFLDLEDIIEFITVHLQNK